jgi:hypothetical protein
MTTPNRPPLWQAIDRAWWSLVDTAEPHASPPASDQAACVILAVRDWMFPDEGPRPDAVYAGTRWDERQRLRALLTAEADRAEQGEAQP